MSSRILPVALIAAGMAFGAYARTVCVAEQTADAVKLAFGAVDGNDYELFVAHGATDGDEDKYAWDAFEKVADVAYDQASYTYAVPAVMRDGRRMRFFLLQTIGVNMAKELDYVRSSSAQWVDTGVAPSSRTMVDFRFGDPVYAATTAYFGRDWTGSRYLFNQQSEKFYFHGKSGVVIGAKPARGVDYRLIVDDDSCAHLWANGVETTTYHKDLRSVGGSGNIAVFGCNNGKNFSTFSFYRMKIFNNGTFQADLIPAMDENGDVGLYDQVNNYFRKNQTATPLVAGNVRPQERFGRVVDSTPSFRFRRSVTVAETTADSVTLAFDNPDGAAYKLYVAYGGDDCRDDKNAWENFAEVATIAGDATEYVYTLPAALKADGVYFRFFLVKTDNLPYAAELASITSTGAQGIRTGYIPDTSTTIDFKFGSLVLTNDKALFGQSWYWGGTWLCCYQSNTLRFGGMSTSSVQLDADMDASADYRLSMADDGTVLLSHNGVTRTYAVTRAANSPCDLTIFSSYPVNFNGTTRFGQYSFHSMLIKDGGIAVRDFVPVQTTAGKGALFDRVSGEIFENMTTTDFTKGQAVARSGWTIAKTEPCLVGSASGAPYAAGGGDITLTEDTEWSAIEGRLSDSATVDLNGFKLHVDDYERVLAKHVSVKGSSGTLHVTIPENKTTVFLAANKPVYTGHLVKDGPGTLVISSAMATLTGVTVEAGIMKYGAQSVFGNNGMTVEVKDGAAFDAAGCGNGNAVRYKIAGSGPDGNGALRNTGGDVGNGSAQMYGLELTADATVCGNSQGLIGPSYAATSVLLNGHTLTLDLASGKSFWFCNVTTTTEGTVYVKSGQAYFHKTESKMGNIDFVVEGANAVFQKPSGGPKCTVRDITVKNGGTFNETVNNTYLRNLNIFDGGQVPSAGVAWIYISDTLLVSNETTDATIYPPVNSNGTYPKLVKKGAGKFTIFNNYTDQRMDNGVEIFGGTVVMSTSRATDGLPDRAISSQPVPVTIHAGGTLDMRECVNPFKVSKVVIDEGGTLQHTADNKLSIAGAATYEKPIPFGVFAGSLEIAAAVTFDLTDLYSGASAPAAGADVTLFSAGAVSGAGGGSVVVTGCPYENYVTMETDRVVLHTLASAVSAHDPIKIWNVGGAFVYGANGNCYRASLGALLAQEGWNVEMTGWRTANASPLCAGNDAWKRHAGVVDLALKTSAARAGLLEGLETYAAAANEPDFTVLICGDVDVADGVADATVLANYKAAVTRIKAALPMTTVIACTIPGGSAELNGAIVDWCAAETDVEAVEIPSTVTAAQTLEECNAIAAAIKAKLVTLATANGKNTPSTWTRPTVTLGAENNVPAEYLAGFTRVRSIEPTHTLGYAQNLYSIPYAYAPAMQETGIAKAGYYIELVRRDTGALQALWIDMDAPGSNWADVALPVTLAQQKQKTVTKLHVWSNFGGVSQVAANDDSVEGYIEFNPINYNETDRTGDVIAEPWAPKTYGFNDTFDTSGASGHGCFQIMRKFADEGAFPAAEILFSYTRWGNTSANPRGIGMGTLADYGNHGYSSSRALDWTFTYGADGSDVANISGAAYSFIRIDFWVKYAEAPARADMANFVWTGATDATFNAAGNWAKDGTPATSLANGAILVPDGVTPTFSYIGYDPISLTTTTLLVDGSATFSDVGGFYLAALDIGATGKITYDPTKFTFRLLAPPTFAPGAKIALTPNYASATKGRFLLMTWNNGSLDMDATSLNALFDTASAQGADVKVWAENLAQGGRLWLDLNYSAPKERVNVLCVGDSITQGSDSSYGNWRTGLMKKLAAAGYAPVAKGHWKVHSADICGAVMPEEWVWHSGISGQRLVTKNGGGTIDAIENTLDQAGDVDFVLVKLCTNDINSNGATAEELFPVWTNLVWKTLSQKPHAKFIAGAVVDIAYNADKDAQVVAYNTMMKNAIEGGMFPAKRAYFADLYTPCYRYDGNGDFITGSFQGATDLHPDWPGEDKMAATYCAAIETAIADDADFELGAADTAVPTTSGAEANVPAEFLSGYTRARVLDVAANTGTILTTLGYVPYSVVDEAASASSLARVGYYIELKRKDNALNEYHGLTRWMWVSMDAFGGRTIDDVAVPLTTVNQCEVGNLRVKTNMPGIESTTADETGVRGWVEFWPSSYNNGAGNSLGPVHTYGYDWNDARADNMAGFGTMQVHRFTPGKANPAQVMFSFNHWTADGQWEIGLGDFSNQNLGSVDRTFTGSSDHYMESTMAAPAYEVARIEIWTAGASGAILAVGSVSPTAEGVTVTGSLEDLGPGATSADVTLEWSTDPAFGTIAGSQAVGTFAETGDFSATVTGLDSGTAWYFRFKGETDNGNTTTSPASAPTGYWRPQTAADVWTSVAWLKDNAGSPVTLNPIWTAMFDGQEPLKTATVQVPEEVVADQVVVNSAADYTLTGTGKISSKRLVKAGAGALTLDAAVLAETPDIEIHGGTVKLADTAAQGAAGKNGGTITVKNGGQFDFNHIETASGNNRARANITSGKTFVIEGDGPDGSGALTTTAANDYWGSPINEVIMTGDASIGGISRIDVRGGAKNSITGPADATLTIKNSAVSRTRGLNVHGPITVGKMLISEEGCYTPEGSGFTLNIPNGIELRGAFSMWAANGAWNVGGMVAVGDRAYIGNDSGTGYIKTPLTVSEGATLTMGGGATTRYTKAVTNKGSIIVANGGHYYDDALVNEGNPLMELNADFHNYATTVSGDSRLNIKSGYYWTSGITDWGDSALDVTMSGGAGFVIGLNNDGYGMPKFGKNKLSITAMSGHTGTVFFHPAASASIDGLTIAGPLNQFFSQGPNVKTLNAGPIVDIRANDLVFSANRFEIGTGNGRGELTLTGENTLITTKGLYANWIGAHYYAGSLTVKDGVINVGANGINEAWTAPARTAFNMENGTLRADDNFSIGKAGMTATFGSPVKGGNVTFDLNGKTVKWGTGLGGASDVTLTGGGSFGPDRPGIQGIPTGKWTVGSAVTADLRNAAGFAGGLSLAENTTATLDIAGDGMVEMVLWTWHDNAWNVLRPQYLARTPILPHVATSLTYFNRAASAITDTKFGNGTGINYMGEFYVSAEQVGKWYFNHRAKTHSGLFIDDTELSTPGPNSEATVNINLAEGWHRFMISAYADSNNPQIGPYSGADLIRFKVGEDGAYTVFDSTTVPMRMRQHLGARTSVRWRKYTHPSSTLDIYDTIDEGLYEAIDVVTNSIQIMHAKFSIGANAPLGGACTRFDGYFKVEPEQAGAWTFKGCFDDQIALDVDGRRLFTVRSNCATASGSIVLAAGWHKYDIRLGDNSSGTSGGTGGGLTDADGNVCALEFSVNGGGYHAFDERYLPLAYTPGDAQKFEQTGLGGEIELAAGSTLVNAPRAGGWCPVYGTLKGSGTMSGPFRFTGDDNRWEVTGNTINAKLDGAVTFDNADANTLAGLKSVGVTFNRKPGRTVYELSDALGMTAEAAANVNLTVVDADGKDYSEGFSLKVKNGKINLVNAHPGGFSLFFR